MKILLVSDNQELKELLGFQIAAQFSVKVRECLSAKEAIDILKKDEKAADLLVGPYNGPSSVLVQFLKERKEPLPVVFFYDPLIATPEKNSFEGLTVVGSVDQAKLVDGVSLHVKDFLQRDGVEGTPSEFCPIRTNLLIRVSPLKGDIYIRLSESKYVKLFRTGDEFDSKDLQRYQNEKKVEFMYLRRLETAEFTQKFRLQLDLLLARDDLKKEEALEASSGAQEAIHELVQRVGFTEEVQDLAKKNVQLTLKSVGSNPKLADLLGKVVNDGNYISQHSTLLAHVACCVAKEMEWGSESTFSKLVLASFMHDIAVPNPELAKIDTLKELEEQKANFPDEQVKGYHLHPAKSADVVRNFKEIPADVDLIVQQHHERPNGSGFPRGLAHNYIAPLAALFILSHELTQFMIKEGGAFTIARFLDEKKKYFNQGNFKKVISSLEKIA